MVYGDPIQLADNDGDPAQSVGHCARADGGPDAQPARINCDAAVQPTRGSPAGEPASTDDSACS